MGKIQKIKEERKKARVEAEIIRKKRKRFIFKLFVICILLFIIGTAGYFRYKYADDKWGIGAAIKNLIERF